MRTFQAVLLSTVALACALPAQANDAYLTNKDGMIVKSATGLCIRTARWTEQKADRACLEKARQMSMTMRK